MKLCEECQKPFVISNNRQKYCKACAEKVNRRKDRLRHQKHRA